MKKYYLAIDIGASGGRHLLAYLEDGIIQLEEIYRFENGMDFDENRFYWNMDRIFNEVITGLEICGKSGKIPSSIGIDTWGVDFVLLGENDKKIENPTAYRDSRTKGMDIEVSKYISEEELYKRTGIQKQLFNSIYQLMAMNKNESKHLEQAKTLLLIPDYLNFMLTGVKATEYTNATTMQLVCPRTKTWDTNLIRTLGFPEKIFTEIKEPGFILGNLKQDIQERIGFDCQVILPGTHDTASAVMAVPTNQENAIYISSGTWSLIGTELLEANCSDKSRQLNFTNEGGYDYRFRYLKNIMGLWMIQSIKQEIGKALTYGEICELASKSMCKSIIDCNTPRFLAPSNMTKELQLACQESNQEKPEDISDVAAVIYNSLAICYKAAIEEIEAATGHQYDCIHIVGGGSQADYLNQLTAKITGKTVYAGPTEATAIGNICCQMIAKGELKDLNEARNCTFKSFQIKIYNNDEVLYE